MSVQQILLVSERPIWRDALGIALQSAGIVHDGAGSDESLGKAQSFEPTSVVIDTDEGPFGGSYERVARTMRSLRDANRELPIVLITEIPRDDFSDLAIGFGRARVLLPEHLANPVKLADEVLTAIATCPSAEAPDQAAWATVEITVRPASVCCDVRVDGAIRFIGPRSFPSRAHLLILNDEWKYYESSDEVFRSKVGLHEMRTAGEHLRVALQGALNMARDFCPRKLAQDGLIYYRFGLPDGDFEFVPFEAVTTDNPNEYLRDVHPFARRLVSREEHSDPDWEPDGEPRKRVLLIVSKADGLLSVPSYTFKNRENLALRSLAHLDAERDGIRKLYAENQIEVLELTSRDDNITRIEQAFKASRFDVVHFAGHSTRAYGPGETGKVFLALPAPPDSRVVVPYSAENLARLASEGQTRLVILSSCESSSGQTLSHMAARGVPAVAGFRWPVDDEDASVFTVELHRQLQLEGGRVAVTAAFHKALLSLKSRTEGRLTGFSPILLLQRSVWHDFQAEA